MTDAPLFDIAPFLGRCNFCHKVACTNPGCKRKLLESHKRHVRGKARKAKGKGRTNFI